MITSAIILAGGMGTRLRSAVPDLPKPMAPINGRPFLEYQMDYWISQGIKRFILSVGYKKEVIINHFGYSYRGTDIEFVVEDTRKGTGGGLLLAIEKEVLPILVLNGDTYFNVSLNEIESFHINRESDWTFALFKANEANRYMGLELACDGKVISMKSGSQEIGCLANGGVYLVNSKVFQNSIFKAGQACSLEDELVPSFLQSGYCVYGIELGGQFLDIGVPSDYYRATSLIT